MHDFVILLVHVIFIICRLWRPGDARSAISDAQAGEFRFLYFGKPLSASKSLVDETTGYRDQIVAGCDVSEPFIAEITAYNQTMRDWHSKEMKGRPSEKP
jgi:hypothetical protein